MKKLKTIDIVLENCESFSFDAKYVDIQLRGIGKHIWGENCFTRVKEAYIQIEKNVVASGGWDNEKWQDRIHHDITQIWLNYEDGSEEGYHVTWSDKSDYENYYQSEWEDKFTKHYFISPYSTVPPEDF